MFRSRRRVACCGLACAALAWATLAWATLAWATLAWATAPGAAQSLFAGKFGLGKAATLEEIAGWDIDVKPDGSGLPRGRGSVADGQTVYDAKCASCHGTFGES